MNKRSRNFLFFLSLVPAIIAVFVIYYLRGVGNVNFSTSRGDDCGSAAQTSQLSERSRLDEKRSTRALISEQVISSNDERVKRVLEELRNFEGERVKISFNSMINGRRNIYFDIPEPTEDEFINLRKLIENVPGNRVTLEGDSEKWTSFLARQFYLNQPTAYRAMISESRGGTNFTYTIVPMGESQTQPKERGSIAIASLLSGDKRWRFSHLIDLGEEVDLEKDVDVDAQ